MSKYVGFRLGKVHESHVISEYYCGGCGWPVTDHDSFCPECGGAFRYNTWEASALEAENAELRELVKDSVSLLDETCDTYYESDYHAIVDRARELGIEVD